MARRSAPEPTYGHWAQVLPVTSYATFQQAVDSSADIVGVQDHYYWPDLESTEGVYTTTDLQTRLDYAASKGKKMIIFISDRSFDPAIHVVPAYLSGYEYYYGSTGNDGWQAERWTQMWADRMAALMNHLNTTFASHAAFEGVCTEETALGSYTDAETNHNYSQSLYRDMLIDMINQTYASRVASNTWLWLYMNYIPPSGAAEVAAMKAVVDAVYQKRVCFGGPNAKMWPKKVPDDSYGWANAPWERDWEEWTQYLYDKSPRPPMFAAFQPADFKTIALDANWNQPRDLLYNFDRVINNTTDIGPSGEAGPFDWGRGTKLITWYRQTAAKSPTGWKFDWDDAKAIFEAYPRWWETRPPAFVAKTYYFDGSTYTRTHNAATPTPLGALPDTGAFTIAFWLNMNSDATANPSTDGTEYRILSLQNDTGQGRLVVKRGTNNNIIVQANDSANTAIINNVGTSTGTVTKTSGWVCFIMSGDRAQNLLLCYLGDTAYTVAWASTATDIALSQVIQIALGATNSGGSAMKAAISQIWLDNRFIDIRKQKLRETIFSDVGRPLFPGDQGRRYDATDAYAQPLLYLGSPDAASVINAGGSINRGSVAGSWTKTGNTISAGSAI